MGLGLASPRRVAWEGWSRMKKVAVASATALSLLVVGAFPAEAHQTGPVRIRAGRAWVQPGKNAVKANWRETLRTQSARVTMKRRVYVEWSCPDSSLRWTSETRSWTRRYWNGPWTISRTATMKGGLPSNPGGCSTTGRARVRILHVHSVAM
jgi:hypothetical protein